MGRGVCYIDVRTILWVFRRNVITVQGMTVRSMTVRQGDVYLSVDTTGGSALKRLSLSANAFLHTIGSLDLTRAFDWHYHALQAGFDASGDLYLAASTYGLNWTSPAEACHRCVMRVSPDGARTVVVNYRLDDEHVQAVVPAAPDRLVVAWQLRRQAAAVGGRPGYKARIELYDVRE